MTLEEKKRIDCKHGRMLFVKKEKLHGNGKEYMREYKVCPDCGFVSDGCELIKKYPNEFKTQKAHPGGKEYYR